MRVYAFDNNTLSERIEGFYPARARAAQRQRRLPGAISERERIIAHAVGEIGPPGSLAGSEVIRAVMLALDRAAGELGFYAGQWMQQAKESQSTYNRLVREAVNRAAGGRRIRVTVEKIERLRGLRPVLQSSYTLAGQGSPGAERPAERARGEKLAGEFCNLDRQPGKTVDAVRNATAFRPAQRRAGIILPGSENPLTGGNVLQYAQPERGGAPHGLRSGWHNVGQNVGQRAVLHRPPKDNMGVSFIRFPYAVQVWYNMRYKRGATCLKQVSESPKIPVKNWHKLRTRSIMVIGLLHWRQRSSITMPASLANRLHRWGGCPSVSVENPDALDVKIPLMDKDTFGCFQTEVSPLAFTAQNAPSRGDDFSSLHAFDNNTYQNQ